VNPLDLEAMARERCVCFRTGRVRPHEDEIQKNCICRELESFAERVQREMVERACLWTPDEDDGSWNAACGAKWVFNDGSPEENGMVFCPACGGRAAFAKPVKEVPNAK